MDRRLCKNNDIMLILKKNLLKELGRQVLVSLGIYGLLFLILYLVEHSNPALQGTLLQWDSLAFIVGIPASIIGTAYVLTIRNPQNYMGFYPGIVMSVLLAWQFYLQGSLDLVFLYICLFIPFQAASLVRWRRQTLSQSQGDETFSPTFLKIKGSCWTQIISCLIVAADILLLTYVLPGHTGHIADNLTVKVAGACTIASAMFANFWMIWKKNDSWLCWVFYCIAGIVLFAVVGNIFSIVLFVVMLLVNLTAQMAWLKSTKPEDFGWAGSKEYIEGLLDRRNELLLRRNERYEDVLRRQEAWLEAQLRKNHDQQAKLARQGASRHTLQGHIVDVVKQTITDGEITMRAGKIHHIRPCEVPVSAPYIMPGLVDSHIHIESTLMLPENYARMAVAQGTTTVIADPHEMANVCGMEGIRYMMRSAQKTRFHFHFGAPSCVPATPFETAGARLGVEEIGELLKMDNVYGLGEMMNVPGVLAGDEEVMAKIRACLNAGKIVDGHAPGLMGSDAARYAEAGISTDHECTTLALARERIKNNMYVQIREGSAACDFDALSPVLFESADHVLFCSDDKYPDEIEQGYINELCRRAMRRGLPLWNVLNAACATPQSLYGLKHGLLQIGDPADLICVDNLAEFNVLATYIDGRCVFEDGHVTDDLMLDNAPVELPAPNHFLASPITVEDICVTPQEGKLKVIDTSEGSLLTRQMLAEPLIENGNVVSDVSHDVLKLVCLGRHAESKPVVAFIHGFGLKRGAMASTIGHDSHNIIALGVSDADIVKAINSIISMQGGLVACEGDDVLELALPVAGLMSDRVGEKVGKRHTQLKMMAKRLGCFYRAPFMTMAFMPLPVIPELKITDKGLFDATKFEFTSLWKQ